MRLRLIARFVFAACLVQGVSVGKPSEIEAAGQVVALIGQMPVYSDEFNFYAGRLRASVATGLMRKHNIPMTEDFWSTQLDGQTPQQVLREITLREIAHHRVIQEMAFEAGLMDTTQTYRQILTELDEENQRRRIMKAQGKVLYGPVTFNPDAYFQIKFEQLKRALERHASSSSELIKDGSLRERIQDRIDELF